MTQLNASIAQYANESLEKAKVEHQTKMATLEFLNDSGATVTSLYAHGYCADASFTLDAEASGMTLKRAMYEVFKPIPTVCIEVPGVAPTLKPLAYVRDSERKNGDVTPAHPMFVKASSTKGVSEIHWWTKSPQGQIINVSMLMKDDSTLVKDALEGWTVVPQFTNYTTGASTYYPLGFAPVPSAQELPIMKLKEYFCAGLNPEDSTLRLRLGRFDRTITDLGWNWKKKGAFETQKAFDAFLASCDFRFAYLNEEEQAAQKAAVTHMVKNYVPWAEETELAMEKCAEALKALFAEKGVPVQSSKGISYLVQYLAETLGYKVHLSDFRRVPGNKVFLMIAPTPSRALYAPLELYIDVDPNQPTLRLQDIPVTYAPTPVV